MKANPVHVQKKEGNASHAGKRPASSHSAAFNPIALLARSGETPAPQTQLTVGTANDPYEREADSIAQAVVSGAAVPTVRERTGKSIGSQSISEALNRVLLQKSEDEESQLASEDEKVQTIRCTEDEEAQTCVQREEEEDTQAWRQEEETQLESEDEQAQTIRCSEDEETQTCVQREEEEDDFELTDSYHQFLPAAAMSYGF